MKVLAFRHVPFEGAGRIEPVLASHNIAIDYADLYVPGAVMPDVSKYDGLIVLGGPMSANDDLDYLRAEMEMLRAEVLRGRAVLGICLGAQLLARALGAEVRRNPVKEIGWFPIEFTPAVEGDALLGGLSRHISFGWANVWQAALFAAIHGDPPRLPYYFAMGLFGGWLVKRTSSLAPAIALHMLNNAVAMGLMLAFTA